jgi:sporulation protein YlmC with PRC-barrel domain
MIENNAIGSVMGATAYDSSGDKIGKVGQVYVDTDSGRPVWASVNTGLFGTSESFVPLHDAEWDGEHLRVGYEKSFVTDAPRIDVDGALSTEDQDQLYRYYSVDSGSRDDRDEYRADDRANDRDDEYSMRDTTASTSDDAAMQRDDDLGGGTRTAQGGRARLRKYVITEEQTITVPVTREEVRLEWEPITDAPVDDDRSGPNDGVR